MQPTIPRRTLLVMTGMSLDKFQSRQRRNQLPSSLTMEGDNIADDVSGYPLADALLITAAEALTDIGFTPAKSKEVTESNEVCKSLKAALKSRIKGSSQVVCMVVCWKDDSGLTPSLVFDDNEFRAFAKVNDLIKNMGSEKLAWTIGLNLTDRLDRVHAGFDHLEFSMDALD